MGGEVITKEAMDKMKELRRLATKIPFMTDKNAQKMLSVFINAFDKLVEEVESLQGVCESGREEMLRISRELRVASTAIQTLGADIAFAGVCMGDKIEREEEEKVTG